MVNNDDLQAAIFEETMNEVAKKASPEMLTSILHNLGEIGAEGSMSQAYKVNAERDDSYITLYSTFDGTASTILRTMAPKVMRKRIPRIPEAPQAKWGDLAFSLAPPKDVVERPKFLCDLHTKNAKREWLDENGLAGRFCPKSNLANPYEVLRHRRAYHNDENNMIQLAEQREIEQQTRDYQKSISEILAAQARESRPNAK